MSFSAWVNLIIGGVILVVVFVVVDLVNARTKRKEMEYRLKSLPDFDPTQQVMGCSGLSGLAVDETRKKICLITNKGGTVSHRIVSYIDILSVELFEDGISVSKTVRSSQIGGAVVGGLLLGGVGAIIGGLSGNSEITGKVNRVDLRLIVNDTDAPLHDVEFMNGEAEKGGIIYNHAIQGARHWHGIVEVLINRADTEGKSSKAAEHQASLAQQNFSIADEIKKLADLYQSGLLSVDEFQQQKTRLLTANQLSSDVRINQPTKLQIQSASDQV